MKKLLLFLIFGACFLGVNAQYWNLTGNNGTTTSNFLGTKDSVSLIFKTNNLERMRLLPNGNCGFGTDQPQEKIHIEDGGIIISRTLNGILNIPCRLLSRHPTCKKIIHPLSIFFTFTNAIESLVH